METVDKFDPRGLGMVTVTAQQPQPDSRHMTLVPDRPAASRMYSLRLDLAVQRSPSPSDTVGRQNTCHVTIHGNKMDCHKGRCGHTWRIKSPSEIKVSLVSALKRMYFIIIISCPLGKLGTFLWQLQHTVKLFAFSSTSKTHLCGAGHSGKK